MPAIMNNIINLWSEVAIKEKPDWISPHTREIDNFAYSLLRFNDSENKNGVPLLMLPPQAGHHSCIVDYGSPQQSLVNTTMTHTDSPVYSIEWKSSLRKDESISDLVLYVDECVEKIGGKAILMGLCQGGWLSAIYTSLFPQKVPALLLGAAPIDFTAGGGKLQDMVQKIPLLQYQMMVLSGGGVIPGKAILTGWKMTNPYDRYIGDYIALYEQISDEKKMKRIHEFRTWYEYAQDISGSWYIEAVDNLFKQNKLIKKELEILGQKVDLGNISVPTALLAGEKDDITLPPQLMNMTRHISTDESQVIKLTIPDSGHIGVFMRAQSQGYWVKALDFIYNALNGHTGPLKNAA